MPGGAAADSLVAVRPLFDPDLMSGQVMKLTKNTHSSIRLEKNGRFLVLDPGVFGAEDEAATRMLGRDSH